jgi:hypothetical protein
MLGVREKAKVLVILAVTGLLALGIPALARAGELQPRPGHVYFGVSDTGVTGQFTEFTELVGKHPAVIESFRAWGADLKGSVKRWESAASRPILHISTADPNDGHELIDPRGIALGYGDDYLMQLNYLFWSTGMRAYIRPLGEPNRCLNVYAAYDCAGNLRGAEHRPYWYKQAFRRMYILLHGGGTVEEIDTRLASAGLPPLSSATGTLPAELPAAPVAVIWSPLPAGSPATKANRPDRFYPGPAYTDWAGTDFYSAYPGWKSLTDLYNRYRRKPFVLTEWGVENSDDPSFVRRLFTWVKRHPRCKMLVYYQDFGTANPYRIQNFPASLEVLRRRLAASTFPPYAPAPPQPAPPPPPSGVAP